MQSLCVNFKKRYNLNNRWIKSEIYNVKCQAGLFLTSFEEALQELASKLDDNGNLEQRVFDINGKKVETSIWFDSFDQATCFSDNTFKDTICFLMAKDMPIQFIEDKEVNAIQSYSPNARQRPKTPAHCVYFKKYNQLLIETTTNAPTISTLLRGINYNLRLESDDIIFNPIYREDILARLYQFIDKIKSIELIDLKIHKYLIEGLEDNGDILSLITNENSKIGLKLFIDGNQNLKNTVFKIFSKAIQNRHNRMMQDIKIEYVDEKNTKEIASLFENMIYLKIEKEFNILDDISVLGDIRIEYSKKIYQTLIEAYYTEYKK